MLSIALRGPDRALLDRIVEIETTSEAVSRSEIVRRALRVYAGTLDLDDTTSSNQQMEEVTTAA